MLRQALQVFKFSTDFYHPCSFNLDANNVPGSGCSLGAYVDYYRRHGHHYAKLDPLGLYNK